MILSRHNYRKFSIVKAMVRDRPLYACHCGRKAYCRAIAKMLSWQYPDGKFEGRSPFKYASGQMVDGIRSTGKFQSLSGRILGFSRSTIYEFEAARLIVPGVTWALGEHLITWYVMLIPHQ